MADEINLDQVHAVPELLIPVDRPARGPIGRFAEGAPGEGAYREAAEERAAFTTDELNEAAEALATLIPLVNRRLLARIEQTHGCATLSLLDAETGAEVRRIGPEEVGPIVVRLREFVGLTLDTEM